ncbi:MAG: hypothetical protein KGS61_15930, partial [Verrucomicrobia bacterium]|nr:hypothetical protein [Verrucomicrobiota bacterium]
MPPPRQYGFPVAGNPPGAASGGLHIGSAGSGALFAPQLSTNFVALIDDHTANPPDTQGAVGPNHLMVTLNTEVAVQTRATSQTAPGQYLLKTSLSSFWSDLGYDSLYDPRVVYDPLADRWVTVVLANPNTTNSALLIAASASPDPTGNWNELAIPVNPAPGLTNQVWADYPNLGFNGRWVVVTVNLYGVATNSFTRAEMFALDQDLLFTGAFSYARLSDQYFFNLVPATTFDRGETNLYFV